MDCNVLLQSLQSLQVLALSKYYYLSTESTKLQKGWVKVSEKHHEEGSTCKVWPISYSAEIGSSPVQKLFSWRTHNFLPLSSKQLEPKSGPPQDVQEKLINSKQKQAFYYTLKSKAHNLSCNRDRPLRWRGPMNPPGRKLFARKWLTHILMWLYRVVKPATKSPTAVNGASIWYSAHCKTSRRASAISAPVRFSPSCKTAAELLQSVRTPYLLWNLLLNMWNLCLLLLLQGVVVFSND